jgi:hypothetical protein
MDLEQELNTFQQKYDDLEEQSPPGSEERHVYGQIASFIHLEQDTTPAPDRAAQAKLRLIDLAEKLNPPSKRYMVREVIKELNRIAPLPPLR